MEKLRDVEPLVPATSGSVAAPADCPQSSAALWHSLPPTIRAGNARSFPWRSPWAQCPCSFHHGLPTRCPTFGVQWCLPPLIPLAEVCKHFKSPSSGRLPQPSRSPTPAPLLVNCPQNILFWMGLLPVAPASLAARVRAPTRFRPVISGEKSADCSSEGFSSWYKSEG